MGCLYYWANIMMTDEQLKDATEYQTEMQAFLMTLILVFKEQYPDSDFLVASYRTESLDDHVCAHSCCRSCFEEHVKVLASGALGTAVEVDEHGRAVTDETFH